MAAFVSLITPLCIVISAVSCSPPLDNLRYVGCYDLSYSLRRSYHHPIRSLTLGMCVTYCQWLKTRYAGVEKSDNYCYCGGDIAEESVQRNNSLCNVPCPDDSLRTCGGEWLMSLYEIPGEDHADVDTVSLDFLLGISTGVRLYHYHSTNSFETLMNTTDWVYTVDYHLSRNFLFVYSKGKIYRAPLDLKRPPRASAPAAGQLVREVSDCDGFAVDWANDRIYWADCHRNGTSIMSMALDGSEVQEVLSLPGLTDKNIKRMEVDPYKGMVFWIADGVLQACHLTGTLYNPNVTQAEVAVRALTLDLAARRVYYVGAVNTSVGLFSVDYHGGDEVEHFSGPQFRSVYGLSLLADKIFWVNYANVRDVLYEAPINLTRNGDMRILQTIDRAVWHMRVVHPSLQQRPKVDPCLDKECAHSCVAQGAKAQCRCPLGQALHHDGVSCGAEDQGAVGVSILLASVLMVLAVILASLLLVYAGDKYWSLLESKLFGIPYSRSHSRTGNKNGDEDLSAVTSEYHTGDDNIAVYS